MRDTTISAIIERRYSRRAVLKAALLGGAGAMLPVASATASSASRRPKAIISSLTFTEVPRGLDATHHLAPGYQAQVLLRWGDPVLATAPGLAPDAQSAATQEVQFGYNNDYVAYFPINGSSQHGLLCVNHEYTNPELMFPGGRKAEQLTDEEHRIEMEAIGCSVVELRREDGVWNPQHREYNRRISVTTPIRLRGPAAGDVRLRTTADPEGVTVLGTLGNCAGGQTPWGTYLTCEENFDDYFYLAEQAEDPQNQRALGVGAKPYHRWDKVDTRFDTAREPNEPNRFGWVVEIDPFDPMAAPIKRTALGRFKHESATPAMGADGRVVVYSGDDEAFEHMYKFVSRDRFQAENQQQNKHLLDHGTLYVARFHDDGTLAWLPLLYGEGPLNESNGFRSQADVLIDARRAAKLLGATPMDRPEDIAVHPQDGRVFITLTKNPQREHPNFINRRAPNPMGYILEIAPPVHDAARDHAATAARWDLFLEGGDPQASGHLRGSYGAPLSEDGWLACPDNLAFDPQGRLWITTDGQPDAIGAADGVYATDTAGSGCGLSMAFFRAPIGAEVTGPCFTPDARTLFVAVQHPAEGSTYDNPSTNWPDSDRALPPRPSVLAITRTDGGVIGG